MEIILTTRFAASSIETGILNFTVLSALFGCYMVTIN